MDNHDLLLNAFTFLTAAVLVVPLAKRVGLGSVLGYLLTGVAIGPFGLSLVSNPQAILHFAEFGVVMMLFLIGLELEPATLWRLRRPVLGLGGGQVILTAAALAGLGHVLGLSWSVAAVVGLGLALSSTAIALQTLNERNLLQAGVGQSAFSVLLFQDVAVIPILALLPLLGDGSGAGSTGALPGPAWVQALSMVGGVISIALAGRYLLRPVFRYIANSGIREIFTAFSLLLVIGIALMMQALGLSAALGTFLAGVVLAESEYKHALESDIQPFKGLLLGLFFISVGMSVDFALLLQGPWIIVGLTLTLVVVKFGLLNLLGRMGRLSGERNLLFSIVLAQGGEFAFVIFQFATLEGAMPPALAAQLTLVVALSMATTPLLLLVHDHLLARRVKATTEPEADIIDEESKPVIIFGYGRFGQVVGRFLEVAGIETRVLDNDPDHIEVLRRFGHKVFYGDASRMDLMEAAGAHQARLFILAIDDPEKSVQVARLIQEHFPHVTVLARARNRVHAFKLRKCGVKIFRREMFDSALRLGREALVQLGHHPYEARRTAMAFARHDLETFLTSLEFHDDEGSLKTLSRRSQAELGLMLKSDRDGREALRDADWGAD
ncbi:glutathione-regulated potassium-efflux system protein KefC [Magnetospira sp. QH-2]|uniref:glutathione-regulated potassium-efflux system protein KefC n=1 Tax=Magnetospira sp. (strain QH-2) TaxID=1288970 RepID=UPI0003E8112F|nr:glutathione-regulated potassium-efflux system protein KefC [Magnetospira sp. QH-2]CCQ74367.1 Glutathione-regulated potassium-efflux system protein\